MKKFIFTVSALLLTPMALAKGIEIRDAYARPTLPGMTQGGAFVKLTNTDSTDNVLLSASTKKSLAGRTELHTHINDDGVMRMREVKDGIPLPAGQTVELKPMSYHIMFFDLKKPLIEGNKFPVTLKFKNGQSKKITVEVKKMTDTMPQSHKHHEEHGHEHHGHEHNHNHQH